MKAWANSVDLLKITSLGGLSVQLNNHPVTGFVSRKVDALLVYLVANPREHPRELLGEMLWDDLPQARTMSYLRTTLSSLQKQLADYLIVTRQTIAINPESNYWFDVAVLDEAMNKAEQQWRERGTFTRMLASELQEALALYNGSFLQGFNIRSARGFEGWMILEQERLHNHVLEGLYRLGSFALERGNYSSGVDHIAHAIQLDPLWEKAHRQMMMLQVQSGQRAAAIAQYEACRKILDEELGIEPEEETTELFKQIQSGEIELVVKREIPNNLPTAATAFVERPFAMQRISEQLDQMDCRLLTLVGPGGIGKSRLALEVAKRHLSDFQQGVYFVNFVSGRSPDIVNTIANVIDLRSRHDRTPSEELIQYLQDREILLVLDNFDYLIEHANVLSQILSGAPSVKMMVTARERLNLQEEWLYNVNALPVPHVPVAGVPVEEILTFPSIQLFDQSARRMNSNFRIMEDLESVIEICHLVQGVPLAIELAASWTRMMPVTQILDEIHRGLDILSTTLRNVPERHRSMRAVFESSWNQITEDERRVFRRLSVFRGGFNQVAGQKITDASIFVLSTLVDKSLLTPVNGRYDIHELLRQFAEEKLRQDPAEYAEIMDRHCTYYATFMAERDRQLSFNLENTAFDEVMSDIDNVWAAWDHALRTQDVPHIDQFLMALYRVHDLQSRYRDGETAFRVASETLFALQDPPITAYRARMLLGACVQHLTRFDEARDIVESVLPVLIEHGNPWDKIVALRSLANIAYSKGDYLEARKHFSAVRDMLTEINELPAHATIFFRLSDIEAVLGNYKGARQLLEESRDVIEISGGTVNVMRYCITMGDVEYKLGQFDAATRHFEEALEYSRELEVPTSVAVALVSLGRTSYATGDYEKSIWYCEQSIEICNEIRNMWGTAFALMHMGRAYFRLGEFADAQRQFRLALEISKEIKSRWIRSMTLRYRAAAHHAMGNFDEAMNDLRTAYAIASEISARPVIMEIIAAMAGLLLEQGNIEAAIQLAAYVRDEPVSEYETLVQAEAVLDAAAGPATDLDLTIESTLADAFALSAS